MPAHKLSDTLLALQRLKQKDPEFEANLGSIARPSLKKKSPDTLAQYLE